MFESKTKALIISHRQKRCFHIMRLIQCRPFNFNRKKEEQLNDDENVS